MTDKPPIGEYIRNLLADNKMTMKELAERSGYDPAHVSRVLNGKMSVTTDFLRKIAPYLLGTTYEKLLQVAGMSETTSESNKPATQTASGMEQRIGTLTAELMELIQNYTEYRVSLEWAKVHAQSKAKAEELEEDFKKRLNRETEAQVQLMRRFLDSVLDQRTADVFGYVQDNEKFELATKLTRINVQQTGILRSLVEQFIGG